MITLSSWLVVLVAAVFCARTNAHTILTYPGWRGNNIYTNGTPPELNPGTIGIDHYENGSVGFPFGMQWMYPCGGMPMSTNRTKWPVNGGAVAFQPGWQMGFQKAFMYINIGINEPGQPAPLNYSHNAVPAFELTGPNNSYWPGSFCIPQVGMPANLSLEVGTNITIQVVTAQVYGAALYSCVDVTLADPSEVERVTSQNCFNSSDIGFQLVFSTASLSAGARTISTPSTIFTVAAVALATALYALL